MAGLDPRISGVCPVVETPFTADGTVDDGSFVELLDRLASTGVTAMMFPGFASEFHKLADAEVDALVDVFCARGDDRIATIVSVPTHATTLAVRRAERAVAAGADAINVLPPSYLRPSDDDVVEHIEAIARAVDPVPVIVQYAPVETGTALDVSAIAAIASRRPNLLAVKVESSPPDQFIRDLAALDQPVPAFVGYAGLSLPGAVRAGVAGVQPGCSFTELYVAMWDAYRAGDLARGDAWHARLRPYLERWMSDVEHIVAVEKHISWRRGLIETDTVRRPGRTLDDQDRADVDRFLLEFAGEFGGGDA